jgi:branched-chain amino acid transport system substrate-binding protein
MIDLTIEATRPAVSGRTRRRGFRSRRIGMVCVIGALAVVAAACSSSSKKAESTAGTSPSTSSSAGGSNQASAPGVTPTKFTIGLVTDLTGVEAAQFNGAKQGVDARFRVQNAEGGIDGRQLDLAVADDASNPQNAQTAVADLISKNVFGLIFVSGVTGTAYRVPQSQGIPVVGAPVDGVEWGTQPNTNMFSVGGNEGPTGIPVSTLVPSIMKIEGATNVASLGYGNEPASALAAKAFTTGAKAAGLKVGYENYAIPLGSVNMTTVALAMKQAQVDGFYAAMINTTNFALLSELRNEGSTIKGPVMATGYGQEIFGQPTALAAGQGGIFGTMQTPVELKTPATIAEQQAFQKYENFSGIPNLNWSYGWLTADLFIQGLKAAGQNPTRASFISGLHNVTNWDGGGLLPAPVDLSLTGFGKFPSQSCQWYVKLQGSSFVPQNGGKPVCGQILTG